MATGRDTDAKQKFEATPGPGEPLKVENNPEPKAVNDRWSQGEVKFDRKKKNPFKVSKDGKTLYVDGDPNVVGAAGVKITDYERVEFSNGLVVETMKNS